MTTPLAGMALLAGCSQTAEPRDELQVTETVTAAAPATSPTSSTPAGTVVPLAEKITSMVAVPPARTIAVATTGPTLLLLNLDNPAEPARTVDLPGPATALSATATGVLASVGSTKQVVTVPLPAATPSTLQLQGAPGNATTSGELTLVPLTDTRAVDVLRGGVAEKRISGSMFSADQVLATGQNVVVLDRLRTALFDIDLAGGTVGAGQRAGAGAANATTDRYGRVLVTDTRGGALLAFTANPIMLRQRYPVPGAPYGIAYDPKRDLAWVTLTERNEVVGYNVAGGEPRETHRFATVVQPNSVTVDPDSGRVYVASATGGGVQVMQP
nr:Probable conserved lipoprotein LppL [Kibdelosporangium sp. MJ126-NF4]CTQ88305.1 Probable conserved lipoprotein LppL [Kibdelosporangium sp. MJ126-NF4]